MKKLVAFILCCGVIMSLSACSSNNNTSANSTAQTPGSAINSISNSNSNNSTSNSAGNSATQNNSGAAQSVPNESEYQKVDITLDNYKEYFEISDLYKNDDIPNKFNSEEIIQRDFYCVFFKLKDGFDVLTASGKSDVKIKYSCVYSDYAFDLNRETGEWKVLELLKKGDNVRTDTHRLGTAGDLYPEIKYGALLSRLNSVDQVKSDSEYSGKCEYTVNVPEDITITEITGTLYVKKSSKQ